MTIQGNARRAAKGATLHPIARLLLAGGSLLVHAVPAQAQGSDVPTSVGEDASPEVVVTARRREENLQEVPVSVAALNGDQLEARSVESVQDLGRITPNFTFSENSQAGRLGGLAFIRGIGQRDPIAAYDPAVGTYIDGVYMGRMWGNNLDLMDVERVEVLRGPQGTLFGKNTTGGAINIITRRPDASPSALGGRVQLTYGSYDRLDISGSINVPLVADRLAVRLAIARNTQDGYGERVDGQEMADTDRIAMRAQMLIQPSDRFSALLNVDYLEFDERNGAFQLRQVNSTTAGAIVAYNNARDPNYDNSWIGPDYFYNGTGPNSSRGTIWGASLTLTYEFAGATLTSISSYREVEAFNDLDPDGSPIVILSQFQSLPQNQLSQELQLSGRSFGNRFDWVVGVFYFEEEAQDNPNYSLLPALFGGARDFGRRALIENESLAFFGQGTFAITERLRLTAGMRYTDDRKDVSVSRIGFQPFGPLIGRHDSTAWSPRLGLDYRWSDDVMTYISVAKGARNGGFTGRPGVVADFIEFDDETVWTYEAGLRTEFWNGRGRFNATAFYSRFQDLQLQINGTTLVGNPPSAQPFTIIANVPRSSIRGGELEFSLAPDRHWLFTAGLGLTYARYDELPSDPRFVAFVNSGQLTLDTPFPFTPEVSFAIGAQYRTRLFQNVDMTARVDYDYRSHIDYAGVEFSPNAQQPGYGLLNARLTFETTHGISLALFGTNLTDETYIIAATDDAPKPNPGLGFSVVTLGRRREFGATLSYRF